MIETQPPLRFFTRPNFFTGRLLVADDLEQEQQYHIEKQRLHNRTLHGSGIVAGLAVSQQNTILHVGAGLALDCLGREIVVPEHLEVDLREGDIEPYLALQYQEVPVDSTPVPGGEVQPERLREQYVILWADEESVRCSRRGKAGEKTCGRGHPVPIARVKRRGAQWILMRTFKPARVR
jgi:hypothetical protein